MAAELDIRIRVHGNREVRNALRGINRAVNQSEKDKRRSGERTTDEVRRQEKRKQRVGERAAKAIADDIKRHEKEKRREYERTTREFQRNERTKRREQDRAGREQRRGGGRFSGGVAAAAGGAAVGLGVGVAGRVNALRGAAGFRGREERFGAALQFRQRAIRLGQQSGLDTDRITKGVTKTATESGVDPLELLSGLQTAQERFDDAEGFLETLDEMAKVQRSTEAGMQNIIGTLGAARRQFKLSKEELRDFTGILAEAANRGNIDFPEFAGAFGGALGNIKRFTGKGGLEGAKDAVVLAQLVGSGDTGAPEAATRSVRMLQALNDVETQGRIKDMLGFNVADKQGNMKDLNSVLAMFAKSEKFQKPAVQQEIFREIRGLQGMGIVVQALRENPEGVAQLQNITPEQGMGFLNRTTAALNKDVSGRIKMQQASEMSKFINNSEGLMTTFEDLSGPIGMIQAEFPLLAEAADAAKSALIGLAAAVAGSSLMQGAGGAAGAARGAVGAAGKAGGAVAGLGIGFGLGTLINEGFRHFGGKSLSEGAEEGFSDLFDVGAKQEFEDESKLPKGTQILADGTVIRPGEQKRRANRKQQNEDLAMSAFGNFGGEPPVVELGPKTRKALQQKQRRGSGGAAHDTE